MSYPLATKLWNGLSPIVTKLRRWYFVHVWKMDIGAGTRISLTAKLDKTNPRGIHIGKGSNIAFGAAILTHDFINRVHSEVRVGDYCLIGAKAIVFPGITIGDHCIVAAGSVVMQDVPPHSLVAGNPARIAESNIVTGHWGARIKSGPSARAPETAASGDARGAPSPNMLAVLQGELPQLSPHDLDTPFERLDVASIDLVSLRASLEQASGTTISDEAWTSIVTPGDALRLVSAESSPVPAATIQPATERRLYQLNMPQMALSGMSESWLCKEIGDIHWSLITNGLRTPSSELKDAGGSRLYATFTRLKLVSDAPLTAFRENETVTIEAEASRFGGGVFFSEANIEGEGRTARMQVMSSFSKYGEAGANTSLLKGQPEIPSDCRIPALPEMPAFGTEYRARRAARLRDPIFECEYEIVPPHDINGVGLLYFAAYPMIADICASRHAGRSLTTEFSTRSRDVFYFANCDPSDTLIYRLHDWREAPERMEMEASISRKSDGVLMAYLITGKEKVRAAADNERSRETVN